MAKRPQKPKISVRVNTPSDLKLTARQRNKLKSILKNEVITWFSSEVLKESRVVIAVFDESNHG